MRLIIKENKSIMSILFRLIINLIVVEKKELVSISKN